ncbi:MAG: hypothetical protein ACF788_12265 [Novipirellula sp. JB048]
MVRSSSPITDLHYRRNAATAGDRDGFAEHRRQVMNVILGAASSTRRRLCLLGAGNGNDLDLEILANQFEAICLVDLDPAALRHCVARLPSQLASRITLQPGIDVSGILPALNSLHAQPAMSPEQIAQLASRARTAPAQLELGRWDVVVSTCLVSQLIDSVVIALGADHPACDELILSVRDGHLGGLGAWTHKRGASILITDFVSSDTLPELPGIRETQLQSCVHHAVAQRNFFTGLNPAVLLARMRELGRHRNATPQTHPAWRWTLGPRCYAVCAIELAP